MSGIENEDSQPPPIVLLDIVRPVFISSQLSTMRLFCVLQIPPRTIKNPMPEMTVEEAEKILGDDQMALSGPFELYQETFDCF